MIFWLHISAVYIIPSPAITISLIDQQSYYIRSDAFIENAYAIRERSDRIII